MMEELENSRPLIPQPAIKHGPETSPSTSDLQNLSS